MSIANVISKQDLGEPYDRLSDFLELEDIVKLEQACNGQQIKFNRNCDNVHSEYPELTSALGISKAKIVINLLGGMRVYFPTLRKSAADKIKQLIISEFNGYNYRQLAFRFGYSERHIRNLLAGQSKKPLIHERQLSLEDLFPAETG